jgi:hypothetical protein
MVSMLFSLALLHDLTSNLLLAADGLYHKYLVENEVENESFGINEEDAKGIPLFNLEV